MGAFLVATGFALVVSFLLAGPALGRWRRSRLRARAMPVAWRRWIARDVPLASRLPAALRPRFEGHVMEFAGTRGVIGCAGLEVDERMRVVVAAHAALLAAGRPELGYANLRDVLLYPGAFAVERTVPEPDGLLHERREVLSGESWSRGQVVLSWSDVLEGAANPADGRNVALHELAHQEDQEKGRANGAPPGLSRERARRWAAVFAHEFAALQAALARGEPTLIDPYGATSPAEFFAVATEAFFERPREMAWLHPALYAELAGFYRLDPANWPPSP